MVILIIVGNRDKNTVRKDKEIYSGITVQNLELTGRGTSMGTVTREWRNGMTGTDGLTTVVFQWDGKRIQRIKSGTVWLSNKTKNRIVRARNGNRNGSTNLKIIHWNGGSKKWENKLLEIESLLLERKPDICYISEANLWAGLDPMDSEITGYQIYLPNTMTSLNHARLVLLVRDNLKVEILTEKSDKEAAMVWLKVGDGRRNSLLVRGMYRQHQLLGQGNLNLTKAQLLHNQETRWKKIIRKWKTISRNKNCVVIGDLNLDHLRWSTPEQQLEKMVDIVKESIETSGFRQVIAGHTRTWRQQAPSLLNQVWTNCPERVVRIMNETRGSSDHNVVSVEMTGKNFSSGGNTVKRIWRYFEQDKCMREFRERDWSDVLLVTEVDVANSMMEERITEIMDRHAPMRTVQNRGNYNNWISRETKQQMERRDMAREIARASDLDQHWEEYRQLRNTCTSSQRQDKKQYLKDNFRRIEEEKDTSKLFSLTKSLMGRKGLGPPTSLKTENGILRKQIDITKCQVIYYENKIRTIKMKLPQVNTDPLALLRRAFRRWIPPGGRPGFKLRSVTEKEVGEMIGKLKQSHTYGIDRIDATIIKMAASVLIPGITHTINLSLSSAKFPARWKLARVLPLLRGKESDPYNLASYRPVCLLLVMSKLAERAVQCQLLDYLEETNQLSEHHHAYRNNHNTSTVLIHLMDMIATAADDNNITATMNIDLTAAFDCVPHGTLKDKLEYYGLDKLTRDWISSYLDSRSSFVIIGSTESRITSTPHGVPQGSVLGPLLYLIFVNEMTSIVEDEDCRNELHSRQDKLLSGDCEYCGRFPMYADNGQFQYSSNSRDQNQDKIVQNFWKIRNYLNANGLQVNEGKTSLT